MFEVEREQSRRTASATFRISERAYQFLRHEAERQDTSINTLVNQVFDAHFNDHVFLDKLDFMRVNKLTMRRVLEGTSEQSLVEAGLSSGTEIGRTITLGRGGGMTLEGLLETISELADFSGFARYSEMQSTGKRVIVLTHELGPKWSVFIESFVTAAFKLVDLKPKITMGERSVVVEVQNHT